MALPENGRSKAVSKRTTRTDKSLARDEALGCDELLASHAYIHLSDYYLRLHWTTYCPQGYHAGGGLVKRAALRLSADVLLTRTTGGQRAQGDRSEEAHV